MSARELLETIEARGGVATIKHDGGAVKLNVSPRGVALELATDIQRFKPALLELLTERPAETPENALNRAQLARTGNDGQTPESGPQNGFMALRPSSTKVSSTNAARDRVKPEIRRVFSGADVLAIGRLLLCLDNGENIE